MVRVADDHDKRGSGGLSLKNAGEDLHRIGFVPGSGRRRLSGSAPVQFALNECGIDRQSGGDAIDGDSESGTVRFAECGNGKNRTERIIHNQESFVWDLLYALRIFSAVLPGVGPAVTVAWANLRNIFLRSVLDAQNVRNGFFLPSRKSCNPSA